MRKSRVNLLPSAVHNLSASIAPEHLRRIGLTRNKQFQRLNVPKLKTKDTKQLRWKKWHGANLMVSRMSHLTQMSQGSGKRRREKKRGKSTRIPALSLFLSSQMSRRTPAN